MDLDKDNIIRLIQEYEKRRVLWDPKDPWRFHKQKKNDAWQEIAQTFSITIDDAKKKLSSLLGSFRREKSKGTKTISNGNGASEEVYKSDWFAFKSFSFLLDKDETREEDDPINSEIMIENIENVDIKCEVHDAVSTDESVPEENTQQPIEPDDCQSDSENFRSFVKPTTLKRKMPIIEKMTDMEDHRIKTVYKILKGPSEREDSTTKFAKYIADKLNQFDPCTKSVLIHKINTLIFETEMSTLYNRDTTSSSIESQNPACDPLSSATPLQSVVIVPSTSPTHHLSPSSSPPPDTAYTS